MGPYERVDTFEREVGRRVSLDCLDVGRVVALPEKDGRDPAFPATLDRVEDTNLVVNDDVVVCRIAPPATRKRSRGRAEPEDA